MGIVPTKVQDLLAFTEAHAALWRDRASSLGLSGAQAEAFSQASSNAKTRVDEATLAENARKAATVMSNDAVRELRRSAGETLAIIKAFADNSANPAAVYALAEIPEPATPAPLPPPGVPTDFTVQLTQSGVIELKWKCANPAGSTGTIYEVRRRTGSAGEFTFVGVSGTRAFTDDSLPAGSTGVTYQITAVRSTKRGLPGQFNVNFGVAGGGGMFVASVTEGTAPVVKMAA
jgi:hypothetical protein